MCGGYNTLELDFLLSGQLPHQEASQRDPFDEHRFCVINEGEIRGYGGFIPALILLTSH